MPSKKPSQAVAWLGFGISLLVLIVVTTAFLLAGGQRLAQLLLVMIMGGGLIWLLGLILSVMGFNQATKRSLPIWPGVLGLIFSCLTPMCPVTIATVSNYVKEQTVNIKLPAKKDNTKSVSHAKRDVIIEINTFGELKCYDNRHGKDPNPANMSVTNYDLGKQLNTWLEIKGLSKDTPITIIIDKNVDYRYFTDLIEVLKKEGITNYTVQNPS